MKPKLNGILETALFVEDLNTSSVFYEEVLGLEKVRSDEKGFIFVVTEAQLLLLIKKGTTQNPKKTTGGVIPACGASGSMHVAFAISDSDYDPWKSQLENSNVKILSEVEWDLGGRSLYFHDPDGHLIELATPGVWTVY